MDVSVINVEFQRTPFSKKNIQAFHQIKSIIEKEKFHIIHCQSPIGGVVTRLAARRSRKEGTKVIYTAHGFHFFKGAPIKNWLLFYPIEKMLSNITDVLVTINKEDYERALKFHAKKTEHIPGVGVDTYNIRESKYIKTKRRELGIPESAFLILSVGELNGNKNHRVIIEALNRLKNPQIHYAICGIGGKDQELRKIVNAFNLKNKVHFLGYRNDVAEIYKIADVFAFPSKREGLGLSAIEAMASGLPIITSNIHGINDYSISGKTGYKFPSSDISGFARGITQLYENPKLFNEMKNFNQEYAKKFDETLVYSLMGKIYRNV